MSALYEQARAKALEAVNALIGHLCELDAREDAIITAVVAESLALVEQEARRRAESCPPFSEPSTRRELLALADFCRAQRGTP